MPRGRKKKTEEEFEEEPEEPEEPEEEEPEEEEPEDDMPIMPLPSSRRKKEIEMLSEEDNVRKLEKQLEEAKIELTKKTFLKTAPKRIDELEKAVSENRQYLITMNNLMREVREEINLLLQQKAK